MNTVQAVASMDVLHHVILDFIENTAKPKQVMNVYNVRVHVHLVPVEMIVRRASQITGEQSASILVTIVRAAASRMAVFLVALMVTIENTTTA